VLVTSVRFAVSGGATVTPAFLTRALGLKPPAWISLRDLGARIERLYATGLFANVRYRLEQGELTLLISERTAGRFGLGLRYDSRYKASVLLSGAQARWTWTPAWVSRSAWASAWRRRWATPRAWRSTHASRMRTARSICFAPGAAWRRRASIWGPSRRRSSGAWERPRRCTCD